MFNGLRYFYGIVIVSYNVMIVVAALDHLIDVVP